MVTNNQHCPKELFYSTLSEASRLSPRCPRDVGKLVKALVKQARWQVLSVCMKVGNVRDAVLKYCPWGVMCLP